LNSFVIKNHINTVIEFGSGDCNQLSLANYKNYIGYDVSQTAIKICKKKFINDKTKTFVHLNDNFKNNKKADLSISLEVIFHLIEDEVFNSYMINLFSSSKKYVCIYSSNINNRPSGRYVRHRKFTDWIDKYMSRNWKMIEFIPNKYPFDPKHIYNTSYSDFYFYEKTE
jgi:cyclopropane fatty-acyl-phospholipid synthase-like methyltransferase